jgi:menaquinone-dependent protoporphyrinogen IX oxidase
MGILRRVQFSAFVFYQNLSVKHLAKSFGDFLKLYHQSLSSLVQGYREVTMDAEKKFRFDDNNETVQERLDRFESKVQQAMTGRKKKE